MKEMKALNEQELGVVEKTLGDGCKIHFSTVARVYAGVDGSWKYTKVMGAVCLVTDNTLHGIAIRVIDLSTGEIRFDQELYEGFEYKELAAFFHCFETDDGVAALSFANADEANDFAKAVRHMSPKGPTTTTTVNYVHSPAVPHNPKPTRPAKPMPPHPAPPKPQEGQETAVNNSNNNQEDEKKEREKQEKEREKAEKEREKQEKEKEKKEREQREKEERERKEKEKPKKKGGLFSRLFGGGDSEQDELQISVPENFRHQAHIGWDPEHGFDIRNIPPEWKKLFQAAGVKKSELNNPETCGVIMSVIQQHTTVPGANATSAATSKDVPMSSSSSSVPPPPPPPPMPGTGPKKQPPAMTTSTNQSNENTPKEEQEETNNNSNRNRTSSGASGGDRSGLLQQIQGGVQLRKVDPAEASKQMEQNNLPDLNTNEGKDLVGALQAAMANRRGQLKEDIEEEEDPDDATWSD